MNSKLSSSQHTGLIEMALDIDRVAVLKSSMTDSQISRVIWEYLVFRVYHKIQKFHILCCVFMDIPQKYFCPRVITLCNRLPRGCFPEHYNLNLFKAGFNSYLSLIASQISLPLLCSHQTNHSKNIQ